MAPRTRSNRAEKLAVQKLQSSGVPVNTRGFSALPNELYLEVLSHLPAIPIPQDVWVDNKPDPYRQLTLYYLSQTCQSLRKFFLRYAWERIEVFGGMWTPMGRLATTAERKRRGIEMKKLDERRLAEEILRQLETVVLRNPDLRQYVSIANVTIVRYCHDSMIPEVVQNLSLFPNLHTLQLLFHCHSRNKVFSGFRYPNVRTLSLSRHSSYADILLACPNTKHISIYKDRVDRYDDEMQTLLDSECAGGIEKLGIQRNVEHWVADLAKRLVHLRDLSLGCENLRSGVRNYSVFLDGCPYPYDPLAKFNTLSSLPLHTIRLRLDDFRQCKYSYFIPATPDECRGWIALAKGILAKCPPSEVAKKVIVVNYDKTVEVYSV